MTTLISSSTTRTRTISLVIGSSVNNYNIFSSAAAASPSFPPSLNVTRGLITIQISNGVVVGSTSTATPAMRSSGGWGSGWEIEIIVGSGSARIQGAGGDGGEGNAQPSTACGSGGGGAGTSPGGSRVYAGSPGGFPGGSGTATSGGAGASGLQVFSGTGGLPQNGYPGGPALEASSGGPNIYLRPASGATLQVWGGGGGGGGSGSSNAAGNGGDPGLDGLAPPFGGSTVGGVHGKAYSLPGSAAIIEAGPGTIDDRGV